MLNVRDGAAFVMEMGDVKAAVEGAGTEGMEPEPVESDGDDEDHIAAV